MEKRGAILVCGLVGAIGACGGDTQRGSVQRGGAESGGSGGRVDPSVSGSAGLPTAGAGGSEAGGSGAGGVAGSGAPPFFISLSLRRDNWYTATWCVESGLLVDAGIDIDSLGARIAHGAEFAAWIGDPATCYDLAEPSCWESQSLEYSRLSEEQVAEMDQLMDALPDDRCEVDPAMECDPCLVTVLEVFRPERRTYSDFCCGTQLSPGYREAFNALVGFVERNLQGAS
jgi:hypothetical protein